MIYTYFTSNHHNSIDVNLHSTYIVLSSGGIRTILSCLLLGIGGIYFFLYKLKKPINNGLAYSHFILTILAISILYKINLQPQRRVYFKQIGEKETLINWNSLEVINAAITISCIILCISLLIFALNIGISLLNTIKKTPSKSAPS
jgi:ABC-type Fe3+ transport system permease subunit